MGPFARVPPSQMRVSDAERHDVADALARHFAEGRLDEAELEERVSEAMAAKTRGDLGGLLADLPAIEAPLAAPEPARAPTSARSWSLTRAAGVLFLAMVALSFLHQLAWPLAWGGHPHGLALVLLASAVVVLGRRRGRRRARLGGQGTGPLSSDRSA